MNKIQIQTLEPAVNSKTGEEMQGINKFGAWKLYKINKEYSYFHKGNGEPDFNLGQEYEFNLTEEEKNGYVNKTLSLPTAQSRQNSQQHEEVMKGLRTLWQQMTEINKKISKAFDKPTTQMTDKEAEQFSKDVL